MCQNMFFLPSHFYFPPTQTWIALVTTITINKYTFGIKLFWFLLMVVFCAEIIFPSG